MRVEPKSILPEWLNAFREEEEKYRKKTRLFAIIAIINSILVGVSELLCWLLK